MKKTYFEKDDNWDNSTFYEIYEENNEKYIKINAETYRADRGDSYLKYVYITYPDYFYCKVPELIEWDVFWKLSEIKEEKNIEIHEKYYQPYDLFSIVNKLIKGTEKFDKQGSTFLRLKDITLNTPCGNYYCYDAVC